MGETTTVATLRRVTKRYAEIEALSDVDLDVRQGEVLGVLGPNGAGKTTTVKLLLGLTRPTAGEARLFGAPPDSLASRRRTGAMLQVARVPESMKVREHLTLFASYYPRPLPVAEAISAAGLEGLEERYYGALSGGQKQRVLFALAIVGDPEVLFLDEPTVGMDVEARQGFWKAIRGLISRGRTIVLTTHYLEEADALSDRIVVIDRGRVVAQGTPQEIKAKTAGRRVRCVTSVPLETLAALPGVTSVKMTGIYTELLASDAEPVVRELLSRDPGLTGLEISNAGLDEAFLALTAKEKERAA